MREPAFWHRLSSWQSTLLAPLGAVYGAVAASRLARRGARAAVPVICVGNYHVGGAGKTPTVLALTALLRSLGERPVVVSRGYGGSLPGPVVVDADRDAAGDVGDEPLMMARQVPVVVARDRVAGARLACAQQASVILLDDGFQNPALVKDLSLIVIDGTRGVGNGCVFPAGPLRAPLSPQLDRTDALIVVGDGAAAEPMVAAVTARGKPVLRARLVPDPASLAALNGRRCLAFAGIGDPARFFATLRAHGVEVAREATFADHHAFTRAEVDGLSAQAAREGLTLVTTEKDLARLAGTAAFAAPAAAMVPLKVSLQTAQDDQLRGLVVAALKSADGRGPAKHAT
jgi:tetraacyldisaccharide 4'-kinase